MRRIWIWTLALVLAMSMGAFAKDHGNGNGKGNPHHDGKKGGHHDDDRWETRDGWEYGRFEGDHRPPGWSKGKKVGWKSCGLPPGQAKKYGCYRYRYQERDYYWYKNDVGHIVVRRPVVSIHGGVDIGF